MNVTRNRPDRALETWVEQLVIALRMRDVPGDRIGDLVAEVEAHCAESGQSALEAFGDPNDYAASRAAEVDTQPDGAVRWARTLSPTLAGVAGFTLVGPVVAAAREGTAVEVGWGLPVALVLVSIAAWLLVRHGATILASRRRFAVGFGLVWLAVVLAPVVLNRTDTELSVMHLPVPVAAAVCLGLLAVSVIGAYTWGRVDADPITRPWDGSDRYAGTTTGRIADLAMAAQPWLFVILAIVFWGTTWALV